VNDTLLFRPIPKPADAAVAIIVLEDGRYLMQLRDQIPGIFFPGHWGLFGGAMDPGETAEAALKRELREELAVEIEHMSYFTEITFDFPVHGRILRRFYEVPVPMAKFESMVLGEGAAMRAFPAAAIMTELRVTPYDGFAVWLHACSKLG
jgi:mutator protein MutT